MLLNEVKHSFPFTEECDNIKMSPKNGTFVVIRSKQTPMVHIGLFDDNSFPGENGKTPLRSFRIDEFLETIQKTHATFKKEVTNVEIMMVSKVISKCKIDYIKGGLEQIYGENVGIEMANFEYEDIIPEESIEGEYNIEDGQMIVRAPVCQTCSGMTSLTYKNGIWA